MNIQNMSKKIRNIISWILYIIGCPLILFCGLVFAINFREPNLAVAAFSFFGLVLGISCIILASQIS